MDSQKIGNKKFSFAVRTIFLQIFAFVLLPGQILLLSCSITFVLKDQNLAGAGLLVSEQARVALLVAIAAHDMIPGYIAVLDPVERFLAESSPPPCVEGMAIFAPDFVLLDVDDPNPKGSLLIAMIKTVLADPLLETFMPLSFVVSYCTRLGLLFERYAAIPAILPVPCLSKTLVYIALLPA